MCSVRIYLPEGWSLSKVNDTVLVTFDCYDKIPLPNVTYRRKTLLWIIVLEKDSIVAKKAWSQIDGLGS